MKRPKRGVPEGLWQRCPGCQAAIFRKEAEKRLGICPECDHHFYVSASERIRQVLDDGTFEEWDADLMPADPLGFRDQKSYRERLEAEQQRTGLRDAAITGTGMIRARRVAFGVTDSAFIMGSMGSVVGERLTRLTERATEQQLPLIIVSGSGGGARMHEGIHSLMQMAKVSAALARHAQAGGLFISVLTNPTMGGVAASFASLGDVVFAEPRALIGFAGPRTIKATIRIELARRVSDQRVPAAARLYRPDRASQPTEERDRPGDRLLRQVAPQRTACPFSLLDLNFKRSRPGRRALRRPRIARLSLLRVMGLLDQFKSMLEGKLNVNRRFEILREAVTGTMSSFYVARDRRTDEIVGLKILDPEKTAFFESRFKGLAKPSEGEIAQKLNHPRIVKTLECGITTTGQPYILMEYLEGSGAVRPDQRPQPVAGRPAAAADPPDGRGGGCRARRWLHSPRHLSAELHLHQEGDGSETDRFRAHRARHPGVHAAGQSNRHAQLHGPRSRPATTHRPATRYLLAGGHLLPALRPGVALARTGCVRHGRHAA